MATPKKTLSPEEKTNYLYDQRPWKENPNYTQT